MSASNKDVIRRLYQQVWNERKLEVLDQLISKTHALSDTMTVGASVGPEVYKRNVKRFVTAFPDLHFTVEDYVTEKDKVVASWSVTGTHKGEFIGIAPTGKKICLSGITIHQLADGKILDSFAIWDALGLLQQMDIALPVHLEKWAASAR
jgi:steroid delta-isomerase-like uncharacterized protein